MNSGDLTFNDVLMIYNSSEMRGLLKIFFMNFLQVFVPRKLNLAYLMCVTCESMSKKAK